jgi:hypothetical protein
MKTTMKTHTERLTELRGQMESDIYSKVKKYGGLSEMTNKKTIQIHEEKYQFNLTGDHYLAEVGMNEIIDQKGYEFGFDSLTIDQMAELTDYINSL